MVVYFKEMPASIDEFASSYKVTHIFVKGEIKMAAFETSPRKEPGMTSQKTKEFIEQVSNDPLVELAKEDTYMFVDKKVEIKTTPKVKYPEYYDRKGIEYVPNQVMVGFLRLPSSLEEFGAKYGGKPVNLTTEADLNLQWVV